MEIHTEGDGGGQRMRAWGRQQAGLKHGGIRMLRAVEVGNGPVTEAEQTRNKPGGNEGQELPFCFCDHCHCAALLWKHCDIMFEVDTKL